MKKLIFLILAFISLQVTAQIQPTKPYRTTGPAMVKDSALAVGKLLIPVYNTPSLGNYADRMGQSFGLDQATNRLTVRGNGEWLSFPSVGEIYSKSDIDNLLNDNYYTKGDVDYELNSQLANKEALSNKVDYLNANSTNFQYPSAKIVYDELLKVKQKVYNNTYLAGNAVIHYTGSPIDTLYLTATGTGEYKGNYYFDNEYNVSTPKYEGVYSVTTIPNLVFLRGTYAPDTSIYTLNIDILSKPSLDGASPTLINKTTFDWDMSIENELEVGIYNIVQTLLTNYGYVYKSSVKINDKWKYLTNTIYYSFYNKPYVKIYFVPKKKTDHTVIINWGFNTISEYLQ